MGDWVGRYRLPGVPEEALAMCLDDARDPHLLLELGHAINEVQGRLERPCIPPSVHIDEDSTHILSHLRLPRKRDDVCVRGCAGEYATVVYGPQKASQVCSPGNWAIEKMCWALTIIDMLPAVDGIPSPERMRVSRRQGAEVLVSRTCATTLS